MLPRILFLKSFLTLIVVVSIITLLSASQVCAQVAGAALSGTITDPMNAVVPSAQVAMKNTSTNVARTVNTDAAGFYNAANLQPGTYEVRISAAGFTTEVRTGVVLTVGAEQTLNASLRIGEATQTVVVTAETQTVQLASSAISAVVDSTTVRELPLNGRSWTDLAALQPGVNSIANQPAFEVGGDRGNRGFGSQATISGQRPQQNNYRLDGVSINDYANGAPGSVLGGNLGVDAIQEFSVLTSNYSAEYGKSSGGVVNALTRSGTNSFHGDVYEFFRNSALDARNFFDQSTIPSFQRNQFGIAAGGPIRKNSTFIFGDYEGLRQAKGISRVDTVPSLAARNGQLASGPITVDPAAQKYLTFFPSPNAGLTSNPDIGLYVFAGRQVVNQNFLTTRVDHRFSDKDNLFGTLMLDRAPYTAPDSLNDVLLASSTKRQIYLLEETHLFNPRFINTIRGGFSRESVDNNTTLSAINPSAADASLASVPGRAAGQVKVGGLTAFTGGLGAAATYFYHWNDYQLYDDASLTSGRHSLKFGGVFERMQLNSMGLSNPSGVWSFTNLKTFLTNVPAKFNSGFANTLSPRGLRQSLAGAYIQDDWRLRPNFTLNIGLRYEMITVPNEVQGKLSNLVHITDATPHVGSPWFSNPTLHNFEPRVGFAWDPFGNGKTSVRAGFGLFDVLPLPYQFTLVSTLAAPDFLFGAISGAKLPPGSFFSGAYSRLGASSLRATYIEQNPRRNYVMQWNFNVQRALTSSLTAMVGYVGSRGVHQLLRTDDADIVLPTLTSRGYLWPSPAGSGTTINPNWGSIRALFYEGNSFYDSLEVQLTKRLSHGVQIQGAYTWAKSIDTGSSSIAGDQWANSIASPLWFDVRTNRGLSDFNVGRTLVINGTWMLPGPAKLPNPVGWMFRGWQMGGIFKASDGIPFTPTFGSDGDPLGMNSSATNDFPDRVSSPACQTAINAGNTKNYIKTECFTLPSPRTLRGNAGRNSLIGPGIAVLDFSLVKNNRLRFISESASVQFRAEFFNFLNRANFTPPALPTNTDIFDASGARNGAAGLITSTATTARDIQFALKVIW